MELKSLWKGDLKLQYFHKRTYSGQALGPAPGLHDLSPFLQSGLEEVRVACNGKRRKRASERLRDLFKFA